MSTFLGSKGESHTYQTVAAPESLSSNESPQAMRGSSRIVSIASSSGDQQAGGQVLFQLSAMNASITRKTAFIKARVQLAYSNTLPPYTSTSASSWMAGPGPLQYAETMGGATAATTLPLVGATTPIVIIPQLANAYSIINRSTVFVSGVCADQINLTNDTMNMLLAHSTQKDWLIGDGANLLAIGQVGIAQAATTNTNLYWDIVLPLPHSMFNSERDLPLYLLGPGQPITLQIDLAPVARAFKLATSGVTAATNYTVTNASLSFEAVDLDPAFVDSMRARHKSSPFVLPQLSYNVVQMPLSSLANFTMGINASSVRYAAILPFSAASYSSDPTVAFAYNRAGAGDVVISATVGSYTGTSFNVYLDGRQISSLDLNNPAATFAALKQALCGSITNSTVASIASRESYKQCYFALAQDLTVFNDESTVMGGSPCSQITLALTNWQSNPTFLATVIIGYDSILLFQDGNCTVKR